MFKKFLRTIEPRLLKTTFLFGGHHLTAADFWVGSVYVNHATNDMAHGRAEWAQLLIECPFFD